VKEKMTEEEKKQGASKSRMSKEIRRDWALEAFSLLFLAHADRFIIVSLQKKKLLI